MSRLDIAVCGCGPAGLASAVLLRRVGHRVRVFERFATPQPVGSGLILQPTGLGVLSELGLLERIAALGARIDRLFGRVVPSGRVVLDVRYSAMGSGWRGVAVHRAVLFDALRDVIELWPDVEPLLRSIDSHDRLTFAQYEHFTADSPFSNRLVHVGDAAHATSPQLGQGANMALLDALALARAMETEPDLARALQLYARMRRWHVRLFQWASAAFTPFYQSDSRLLPLIRDWLAAPASRLPVGDMVLARLVSGMTTSPLNGVRFSPMRSGVVAD